MPREIDCPDCGGSGYIPPCKRIPCHPETECEGCGLGKCIPCICKKGKIKVYTESEVQELIKAERTDLEKLLIYVNPITAPHRHGNKIAKRDLDKLTNLQIEIEHNIRKRSEV